MTEPTVFTIDITQYNNTQVKSFCYGPVFNEVSRVQWDISRNKYSVLMLF